MSAVTGRVTLKTPIVTKLRGADGEVTEEQVIELVLRKPIARDMLATDALVDGKPMGDGAKSIALFAHLATVPVETIDAMPIEDFAAIGAAVETLKAEDWAPGSVSALTLRPMLARDIRVADAHQGESAKTMAILATLAGVDLATVQALPLGEFEALAEVMAGPTPPGPPTSGIASGS